MISEPSLVEERTGNHRRAFDLEKLSVPTKTAHLFQCEVSGLHGGNEIRIESTDVLHQKLHTDGEGDRDLDSYSKFASGEWTKPFSAILTIKSPRSIYIHVPSNVRTVSMNSSLIFSGGLPHGGLTNRWPFVAKNLVIHMHFDSIHHRKRDQMKPKTSTSHFEDNTTLLKVPIFHSNQAS